MNILSKHITKSGGLSFVWEDYTGKYVSGFSAYQVRRFLQENITIRQEGDRVWLRRRAAYGGIEIIQRTYLECLNHQINRPAFCEHILSTNTIIKINGKSTQ